MFTLPIRIYYEDTDAGGVVYYANYLKFAERARTEWLRSLGFDQHQLWQEEDAGFVVKECRIRYHAPAFLDDALQVDCIVSGSSRSSLTMQQQVKKAGIVIADIDVVLVCVNKALRPRKIPEGIEQKITIKDLM